MILSTTFVVATGAVLGLVGIGIFLASIPWGIVYSGAIGIAGAIIRYRMK